MTFVRLKTISSPENTTEIYPKKFTAKVNKTQLMTIACPINIYRNEKQLRLKERKKYSKYWAFLFSSIGAATDFGNLATFPALAAFHMVISFMIT